MKMIGRLGSAVGKAAGDGGAPGFSTELVKRWADQIKTRWSSGTTGVVELARVVKEAHDALRAYRAWSWLCNSGRLPFKRSKAKFLLFIGERLVGTLDG